MSAAILMITRNRQNKTERLYSAIDELSKLIENDAVKPIKNSYVLSLTKEHLAEISEEFSWVSSHTLESWYISSQYLTKLLDFKRLKRKWERESAYLASSPEVDLTLNCIPEFVYARARKFSLLDQLIAISSSLSFNHNALDEAVFASLEMELYYYLSSSDRTTLRASGLKKIGKVSFARLFRKVLRGQLIILIQKRYVCIKRDLRNLFRKIFQFLFKNLSDESDAYGFLSKVSWLKKIVTVKIISYNESERHNQQFKIYT